MLKLVLKAVNGEEKESTIIVDEFFSHEIRIHKLGIPEDFHGAFTLQYVHEIDTFKNTKSLLALVLLLSLLSADYENNSITVEFDYLPFSRMDKPDSQYEETLRAFLSFLEWNTTKIKTISSHAPKSIENILTFGNLFVDVESPHVEMIRKLSQEENTYLVAVDSGARKRYTSLDFPIEFEKKRIDGNIVKQEVIKGKEILDGEGEKTFILIDDICSMGTTFTNVGKELRKYEPNCKLHLYVHFMEAQSLNIGLNKELFQVFDSVKFNKII
jgi:phosphoribosylpyrophosphate synthetase